MRCELLQDEINVEAERGNVVYDVDTGFDEMTLVGRGYEPDEDL